jgi:hypothetical protein
VSQPSPTVAARVLGPEPLQDVEVLVHDLAALLERHADGIELAPVPSRRHSHEQPAIRQQVHARELLGKNDRIAHRQDENAGAELDLLGPRCDRGEQRQGFNDRKVRLDAEQDVIPHPKRIEAHLLHFDAVFDQRLDVRHFRIGGEIWHGDAEGSAQRHSNSSW